jgi:hypothetical protein
MPVTDRGWSVRRKMRPQPFDDVRAGDVIKFGKRFRKVRETTHDADGRLRSVTFAILHPSWTDKPYTVVSHNDMRQKFGGIVRRDVTLCN